MADNRHPRTNGDNPFVTGTQIDELIRVVQLLNVSVSRLENMLRHHFNKPKAKP